MLNVTNNTPSNSYKTMPYPVQKPLLQLSLPASSCQSSLSCQAAAPSKSKHSLHTGRLVNSGCLRLPGSFLKTKHSATLLQLLKRINTVKQSASAAKPLSPAGQSTLGTLAGWQTLGACRTRSCKQHTDPQNCAHVTTRHMVFHANTCTLYIRLQMLGILLAINKICVCSAGMLLVVKMLQ